MVLQPTSRAELLRQRAAKQSAADKAVNTIGCTFGCGWLLVWLAFWATVIFVVAHFVLKAW